jgi:hypothetical protein
VQIADRQRLIEAEIVLEAGDVGFGNVRVLQVRREWSARRIAENPVQNDRDEQEQRDRLKRPADDVVEQ